MTRRYRRDDEEDEAESVPLGEVQHESWGILAQRPTKEVSGTNQLYLEVYLWDTSGSESSPLGVSLLFSEATISDSGLRMSHHEGMVFDNADEEREYQFALESEIESFLEMSTHDNDDDNIIKRFYKDDEGKKVEKTDEEMRDEAERLAEQSDLAYPARVILPIDEALEAKMRALGVPESVFKQFEGFYVDYERGSYHEDSEDGIGLIEQRDDIFLNMLIQDLRDRRHSYSGPMPIELAMAAGDILERQETDSAKEAVDVLAPIIPLWAASKNIAVIRDLLKEHPWMAKIKKAIDSGVTDMDALDDLFQTSERGESRYAYRDKAKEFAKACIAVDGQMAWIRRNRRLIHPNAAKKLKGRMFKPFLKTSTEGKEPEAKQMTVEMKAAKKARKNPEPPSIIQDLRDYYFAFPNDPDIPINLLKAEGHTSDELWQAATELFIGGEIEPPDLRGITASITTTPDPHVLVSNPETPSEPEGGTPRERLARALKNLEDVRIVEDRPATPAPVAIYSPTERYLAYSPAPVPVVKVPLEQTSDTVMAQEKEMFEKERAEHPDLPEEVIWQIVHDHMAAHRQNPGDKVATPVVEAFLDGEAKKGPMISPTGKRRDESVVMEILSKDGKQKLRQQRPDTYPHAVTYLVWENEIAALFPGREGHQIIAFANADWPTKLTQERLNLIASRMRQRWGNAIMDNIRFYTEGKQTIMDIAGYKRRVPPRVGYFPDQPDSGALWIDLDADPEYEMTRLTGGPLPTPLPEAEEMPMPDIGRIQEQLDVIENEIRVYRIGAKDYSSKDTTIAAIIGKEQEYRDLVEQRDKLMWRENPSRKDSVLMKAVDSLLDLRSSYYGPHKMPYTVVSKTTVGVDNDLAKLVFDGENIATVWRDLSGQRLLTVYSGLATLDVATNAISKILEHAIQQGYRVLRGTRVMRTVVGGTGGKEYRLELVYRGKRFHLPRSEPKLWAADPTRVLWFNLDADADEEAARILNLPIALMPMEQEEIEQTALGSVQLELDIIEGQIRDYRESSNDYTSSDPEVVKILGLDSEYNRLTAARDSEMWRGNPCRRR